MNKILILLTIGFASLFSSELINAKEDFDKKEYTKAYNKFVKVAQDGMIAKYNIGYMHEKGLGAKQDINKAISFYKMSANDGYGLAKNRLEIIKKQINKANANLAYLTIRSNVSNDKVYINGKYIGKTKLKVAITPNTIQKIEIHKNGYKIYKFKNITLKPKQKKTIKAILKRI